MQGKPMYSNNKDLIIKELTTALGAVADEQVSALAQTIVESDQVFVTGVGRVLLMLQAFVKRLNHLGIKAYYVGEINEPALKNGDLLIVGSGSGASIVPVAIAKKAKSLGAKVVHIGSNKHGPVAEYTDLMVRIPCQTKLNLPDEIKSNQAMSSLFEQALLLLLDAVAAEIIGIKHINDLHALWHTHANLE